MISEIDICKYHLNDDQYIKEEQLDKQWICLHHTCSQSGKFDIDFWNKNQDKIATAYVIERDGSILEAHEDKYWAWHMGLKEFNYDKNKFYTSRTIGIELVNLGQFVDTKKNDYTIRKYRGYNYWQNYTDIQMDKLADLIKYIATKYNKINIKNLIMKEDYDLSVFDKPSIFSHRNVNKGKTDLSPAFKFDELEKKLR